MRLSHSLRKIKADLSGVDQVPTANGGDLLPHDGTVKLSHWETGLAQSNPGDDMVLALK